MTAEGRIEKTAKNAFYSFLNQIVTLVLMFICRTIFIHKLSQDFLGINSLFSELLSMLSVIDLGFNTAMSYSFYKPLAENDCHKIAALVQFYRKVYRTIAFSAAVIGLCILPFLELIVNTKDRLPNLKIYFLISLANIIIQYLYIYKTSVLIADQKNYIIMRFTILFGILQNIAQIFILLMFPNFILYLLTAFICNLSNNIISSRTALKRYPYIGNRQSGLTAKERKDIFRNIKSVFLYKVSGLLLSSTDNTLISILVGTAAVGIYSNYLLINNKILAFYQLLFGSVTAGIGNVLYKESSRKRYEVFQAAQAVGLILGGITISCYTLLINDFMKTWIGTAYRLDEITVICISANLYFGFALQPLWAYREAAGLYIKTKYVMLAAAFINLLLSVLLGIKWGTAGIIAASFLSRLITYFWYEPWLLFRDYFDQRVYGYYLDIVKNILSIIAYTAAAGLLFSGFTVTGWSSLLLKSIVCGVLAAAVFTLIYMRSEGFSYLLRMLSGLAGRKLSGKYRKT